MSRVRISLCITMAIAVVTVAPATQILVPEAPYTQIQYGIIAASNGDTVSVWIPQGYQPPYTYYENIDFLGKSITVINRSYIPNQVNYDSSWDHVIIDGTQSGRVVTMTGSEDVVLKGFTIQHGHTSGYGGGVNCNAGSILKNHIRYNYSASGGGGVYFGNYIADCWIEDNVIEHDTAPGGGGGILVQARDCSIRRNVIRYNTTVNRGGGIKLEYDLGQGEPYPAAADTNITDNVIVSNHLTGSDPKGGGILAWDWPRAARRNVVTDNDSNGIYVRVEYVGPLDLGDADDPGLNVLMSNGSHDLVDTSAGQSITPVHAIGNYWGYLDTHTILGRILSYPSSNVQYDPVAASSKWFDVDLEPLSTCSTDVLVTGELRVTRSLTIVPGKVFVFYHTADTPNSVLTELIVSGSGTVLTSVGTANDTIKYVPQRTTDPNRPDYWLGIRVHSSAYAQFEWSEIKRAYSGIDVGSPYGEVEVKNSRLDSCLFAGAYGHLGSLDIDSSDVSWNGVYGVRYETHSDPNLHCYVGHCTISSNGFAGVSLTGIGPLPYTNHYDRIEYNQIDGGDIMLYGVEVSDTCCWPAIADNQVSGCAQAGMEICAAGPCLDGNVIQSNDAIGIDCNAAFPIVSCNTVQNHARSGISCTQGSGAYLQHNIVQNNTVYGIACFDGSNPFVEWNTIDEHTIGVNCDESSYPDLGGGALSSQGNNSILMDNTYWVWKADNPQNPDSVKAEYNYWGTSDPSQFPGKFAGRVDYDPWLPDPPQDGGQQAAGGVVQPLVTGLDRVQPMPLGSAARISFQLAHAGQVALGIVDASGRSVSTLVRGDRQAGRYNLTWNRTDDHGRGVAAGVYFCTLSADGQRFCTKVVVAR